jgi:hypothetical protein
MSQSVETVTVRNYLLSLPERAARSLLGLGAGAAREVGEVVIPERVRRGQLYQNLVDTTLRFLIEQVGGAEGVYRQDTALADNFLLRRSAGNALEVAGIVAFRASPVWILAALADLSGVGRLLIPEIAAALKAEHLLDDDANVASVDQLLDGLERTAARLAATVNTPPLDVPGLRREWQALKDEARSLQPATLPSSDTLRAVWNQLSDEARHQDRSLFETSSVLAVSAVRQLPDGLRWLSASARVGAGRTGQVVAAVLLDHYTQTLAEIRAIGFGAYAVRQFRPYVRAAAQQFSPARLTLTDRLLQAISRHR